MRLTGKQLIGLNFVLNSEKSFRAVNPESGEFLEPDFGEGTFRDIETAAEFAEKDFDSYRSSDGKQRGEFLETIASELMALEEELVGRAIQETGLPHARLTGELGRTVNQLKLFARLVKEGSYVEARIDRAIPDREPAPKPDLRVMHIALGPVAVFGASNFPLAFSVAGGDTASALAAGCPVVVKGHPAHPGTSELAGLAIQKAVKKCGMPAGTFALIQSSDTEIGAALVQHPRIKALAFTGSLTGGRALFDLAASRLEPIPVYAEMSSVNPVFLLPRALQERCEDLARDFVDSVTLGVGQFCTAPGLLFAIKGPELDTFIKYTEKYLTEKPPAVMLHAGIKQNYQSGLKKLTALKEVDQVGEVRQQETGCLATPVLLTTTAATLLKKPEIAKEVFGPSSVIVVCNSRQEMLTAAQNLQGQLTATIQGTVPELEEHTDLLRVLELKAGRILLNGFPTGVEVCDSMNHGGPYPATTDGRTTSVGTAAIKRFLRPVCYQDFPQPLLPKPLRNKNTQQIWRLIDGVLSQSDI